MPVSGRVVSLIKCELEIAVTGKVVKDARVVWDGCGWIPAAPDMIDDEYCNVNGDADDNDESVLRLQFDEGIVMMEYACVLQVLNKVASIYHALGKKNGTNLQLNTAIALLESLSLGKCCSFPIYYDGSHLARLHVAARHVVHDGPWARRLSDELRPRCACFLACNIGRIIPDDTKCPCTIEAMVDQVKRSTRTVTCEDLAVAERRLLGLLERAR